MIGDAHSPDDATATAIPVEETYSGPVGATRMEAVHWTQTDGTITSVRVHTAVNATSDPALAERLVTGNLNWVQLGGADEMQLVSVPVVYHDEEARLFLLVMPESHRARELAERAALLGRLAEDPKNAVPSYVLGFRVVYAEELALYLETRASEALLAPADESEIAAREEAIVSREAKLSEWEERLRAGQQDLELDLKQREILDQPVSDEQVAAIGKRTQDLDRRENELREVERHLLERQLEVERQEKILQHRAKKLERREQGVVEEVSTTDSPTRVADRESMEMAARESAGFTGTDTSSLILDGPPAEAELEDAEDVAADGEGQADGDGESGADAGADLSDMEAELDEAATPKAKARKRRRRDTEATSLAQAVLAAAEEETIAADGSAGDGSDGDEETVALAEDIDEDEDRAGIEEGEEFEEGEEPEEDDDGEEVPVLPDELAGWLEEEAPQPALYYRDGQLHLAAMLSAERAELFVGVDPAAVFQLHELPTYPLLVIGLVAEENEEMSELDPPVAFWPLDVRSEEDQALMDRLAEDFRFVFEIYDDDFYLVTSSEVHYPLEENARIVRERALLWLEELELEPDLEAARSAFLDPEYRWLPVGELPFGPLGFEELESAAAVVEALPAIGEWSQPDQEDELILLRSFPASRWRRMCLEVLRKAVDFGIWMEEDLRRRALDAGYATSRKDLLRGCFAGFERVCLGELPSELTPAAEHDNWQALLSEATLLGVMVDPSWEALAQKAAKRQEFAESDDNDMDDEEEAPPEYEEGEGAEAAEDSGEYVDEVDVQEVATADVQEVDAEDVQEVDEVDVQEVDAEDLILEDETDEALVSGEPRSGSDGGALAEGELSDMSPTELLALLGDEKARLEAALELCRRQETKAAPELFTNLERMRKPEVIRLFPHLVGLGPEMGQHLLKSLRSGSTIIRQGSALALGALGDDQSAEELVELLLDEPTEIWMEVAQGLGDVGPGALMAVAAHIRHASGQQWERLSHAMAAIAYESGERDPLVELSGSRDKDAAKVARRALDILSERRLEEDAVEDNLPPREKPTLFFSRRFFDARAKGEAELGEEDILEEEDIVQNGDVMAEEPLPDEG